MTIFVIAGNWGEFQDFKRERGLERGVFYVRNAYSLQGRIIRDNDEVAIYGTALMRKDIEILMREIKACKKRA